MLILVWMHHYRNLEPTVANETSVTRAKGWKIMKSIDISKREREKSKMEGTNLLELLRNFCRGCFLRNEHAFVQRRSFQNHLHDLALVRRNFKQRAHDMQGSAGANEKKKTSSPSPSFRLSEMTSAGQVGQKVSVDSNFESMGGVHLQ